MIIAAATAKRIAMPAAPISSIRRQPVSPSSACARAFPTASSSSSIGRARMNLGNERDIRGRAFDAVLAQDLAEEGEAGEGRFDLVQPGVSVEEALDLAASLGRMLAQDQG